MHTERRTIYYFHTPWRSFLEGEEREEEEPLLLFEGESQGVVVSSQPDSE